MKTFATMALVAFGLVLGSALAQDEKAAAPAPTELKDTRAKASYTIGLNIGRNYKAQSIDIDAEALGKGLADGLNGAKPALTDEQAKAALESFQKEFLAKRAEAAKNAAPKSMKEGLDYLAKNKLKPGVKTTDSGLQYEVLKAGSGASPKATDKVKVTYKGTLINGTEFDSGTTSFPLNRVIPGWTEGVQLMKVGSKYRFVIPSQLAYDEDGSPPKIAPNSTLIFEVELLGIE